MVGRSLLAGLVRAVTVVVAGVFAEDRPEVPFVVDQHPVGALGSCGPNPPLGVTVGSWRPRRDLGYLHALASEDLIERTSELGVAVPDEEAEGADPVSQVHEQVAGLLGSPCAVRMGGHTQDVHAPGHDLHDEQHVQTLEEDRADMEEVAGQQSLCLRAQERPPGSVSVWRGWSVPGAQDPPDGCFADLVSEPGQLAVHSAVPPGRVLPRHPRHPQHKVADLLAGLRSAWAVRVRPLACEQAAVPGQQRARVTSRWARSTAGSSRASAARTARSAQSDFGRAT
jgi:hypothetical protein